MKEQTFLACGGLVVDLQAHECLLDGKVIPLTPTQYEIVRVLLENAGHTVPARDLFCRVWNTKRYSKSEKINLTSHIRCLRKRLGDDAACPRFITTVHGHGYRLGACPAQAANTEENL